MQKKKQRQLRARPQFQPMFPEMLLVCLVLPYFHLQYTFNTKAATVVQRKDRAAFGLSVVFVSASPVLIVLLLPVRYSSSASFKFLEAFSFLRQHPLGKRAGRVLSQGLGETSRNFLFLCRNRK